MNFSSISGTNYLKSISKDQIDSNLFSSETSGPSLTDDQNERSSPDDLFGRKSKEKGPDSMQQLQCFPVSQSADEILQWPPLKDIFSN